MLDQQKEDSMNVQLGYMHIPHAEDTEDIVDDDSKAYDKNHSKEWNALVDRRAQALEDEMKIEENTKVAKKKAAEEAKRNAIKEKARMEAEKRKTAQELAQHKSEKARVQTVDFNDIYTGITPEDITSLQTGFKMGYELHSKFFNQEVEKQADELEKTMESVEDDSKKVYGTTDSLIEDKVKTMAQREEAEQATHHKTIDTSELYDGMAV